MAALRCGVVLVVLAFPVSAAAPPAYRWDNYGERLPDGAIARFGTSPFHHPGRVGWTAFSHDSRKLAVVIGVYQPQSLWLWDLVTGTKERRFPLHHDTVQGVCWTRDGRAVLIAGHDRVRMVSVANGKTIRRFQSLSQPLSCMALSPDGKLLAAGCRRFPPDEPSLVFVWDVQTGKELARMNSHKWPVLGLTFSTDSRKLFSTSEDDKGKDVASHACVHEMPSGKLLRRFSHPGRTLICSPDGRTMVSGGRRLVDVATGKDIASTGEATIASRYLPDGKTIVGVRVSQALCLWSADTGKLLRQFKCHWGTGLYPLAVSPTASSWQRSTVGEEMRPACGFTMSQQGKSCTPPMATCST